VAVVPETAGTVCHEAIGVAFTWLDGRLGYPWHTIGLPGMGLVHAVPVHGMVEGGEVVDCDFHFVALLDPEHGAWHLAVEAPYLGREAGRYFQLDFFDGHFKLAQL